MNIKEAKEEIARSVEIYLDKNEFGEYNIAPRKQRPIFMVGAPGIGKTAIMEQIAAELDIALVSYSMTHHTRQSALGLPFIEKREYQGETVMVSEYTMSEIIASVYNVMEKSGKREGILFLDEINCVSETLAPAMLLFLQYKIFGNRHLPEGWVIVTAGNPPQYNKSVKEFDVATLDRMKCITVEEDFDVWKSYAYRNGIHGAVIAFLEINSEWFYSFRKTVDGTKYVTARGWEDLSTAITVYEKKNFRVDTRLIQQYITDTEVAGKFGIYYDLFQKYQSAYAVLDQVVKMLRQIKKEAVKSDQKDPIVICHMLDHCLDEAGTERQQREAAHNLDSSRKTVYRDILKLLEQYRSIAAEAETSGNAFRQIKKAFDIRVRKHQNEVQKTKQSLEYVFEFMEQTWGRGQEMVLFLTELTANEESMLFVEMWGCDSYFRYNEELLIYDIHRNLRRKIADLGLTGEAEEE